MRLLAPLLALAPLAAYAASGSWGFDGASVAIAAKKADAGTNKITCVSLLV